MQIKTLLGERILVLPDESDDRVTKSGIIIPDKVKVNNSDKKQAVIVKKGTGTPWNRMDTLHVKDRITYRAGSGIQHEEVADDGRTVKYLILTFAEILWSE